MIIKLYLLSEHILSKLSKYIHIAGATIFLPAMTILVGLDVILRYVFNAPLSWGKEVGVLSLLLVVLLSMPYCWDKKRHVRMEVVYDYLELPNFKHDFDNIKKEVVENHEVHGPFGNHEIKPKLEGPKEPRYDEILGPEVSQNIVNSNPWFYNRFYGVTYE